MHTETEMVNHRAGSQYFICVNGYCDTASSSPMNVTLRASLEPRMTGMIRSLSLLKAGGVSAHSEQILNGPAMSASLAKAPWIKSVSISNVNPTTIEGPIALTRIDDFLRISPLSTQENE